MGLMKKKRKQASDTIEQLILIAVFGGIALAMLWKISSQMMNISADKANPMIDSIVFEKYLN